MTRPDGDRPVVYIARMIHAAAGITESLGSAHWHWLRANYAAGILIASGPCEGGGVVLAHGCSRARLDQLLQADPVVAAGQGRYEVTEMAVSQSISSFANLLAEGAAQHCG